MPGGFEPNFSTEPTREYTMKHMSLGESVVEVFPARLQGREVEWHIAHDREGRVWVDKIIYVDGHTTTYGTYAEVINAGALSAKPLEYTHQIEGMVMGEDWEKRYSYADITKTIDRIPSIYRYRQARGVFRVQ
ncbi:hypothetical protein B7Z28_00845 [Candidatus Saccharibacteria bacterium 32-45-3]|nr:MAG: hypothetical protein B7Z28_00845 [Candidatus Saccharibacteria bacterium 32-45-3]